MGLHATVAQLVERRSEEPSVGGSTPPLGTMSKVDMDWHNHNNERLGRTPENYLKILLSEDSLHGARFAEEFNLCCPYCNNRGMVFSPPTFIQDGAGRKVGSKVIDGSFIAIPVWGTHELCGHSFDLLIGIKNNNTFLSFEYRGKNPRKQE